MSPLGWCSGLVALVLAAQGCKNHREHDAHAQSAPSSTLDLGHANAGAPADSASGQSQHRHAPAPNEKPTPSTASTSPPGYAAFSLDPSRAAAVGLKTEDVAERHFERSLRTTGVVALDETSTSHVHTKVRGWIESVSADFVGKKIKAGTPLCTIYSQEVYAAELEYLSILQQVRSRPLVSGSLASAEKEASAELLAAGKRSLALWDVPESEVERLERTLEPRRTFSLMAPRSGIIITKQALAGVYVDPSVELYVVSDTSRLWVLSDIYDKDVPFVKVGTTAKLRIDGLGSEEVEAKLAFIPPTVDEATRTLRVRFELPNREGRIRPGAFVTVFMKLDLGRSLAVPESAVIHSGPTDIVFVVRGAHVEPRAVVVGPLVGDHYPVREGLRAGESVAVGAQFLMDSESRLRATSAPGGAHGGH